MYLNIGNNISKSYVITNTVLNDDKYCYSFLTSNFIQVQLKITIKKM